ncbi:MAG: hypothetical protein HY683_02030 [Chloroflexi bacterium]|nr:hypothetical protein [Chloroflexota bacterium]
MRYVLSAVAASLLLAATALLAASPLEADISYSVTPSLLEFAADPGVSFVQKISVTNEGTERGHLFAGLAETVAGQPAISAVTWLRVDPQEFDLEPGATREVTVRVTVPQDAQPGGHYGSVVFSSAPVALAAGTGRFSGGTGVGARLAAPFLLTVRGPGLSLQGDVTQVTPLAVGNDRLGFLVEVRNSGNVHLIPKGEVVLRDSQGTEVGRLTLPEGTPLLPGVTRTYQTRGAAQVSPGDYKAEAQLQIGWDETQSRAAKVDPVEWGQVESAGEQTFNSVPKLRFVSVEAQPKEEAGPTFVVEVENIGDVAVTPAGYLDVLTKQGQRAFTLPIASQSWLVQPHTTAQAKLTYQGLLPKGEYQVAANVNYFGTANAESKAALQVAEDIVPPAAPTPPPAEQAQLRPTPKGGLPIWAVGVAAAGAVVLLGGAAYLGTRRMRRRA